MTAWTAAVGFASLIPKLDRAEEGTFAELHANVVAGIKNEQRAWARPNVGSRRRAKEASKSFL